MFLRLLALIALAFPLCAFAQDWSVGQANPNPPNTFDFTVTRNVGSLIDFVQFEIPLASRGFTTYTIVSNTCGNIIDESPTRLLVTFPFAAVCTISFEANPGITNSFNQICAEAHIISDSQPANNFAVDCRGDTGGVPGSIVDFEATKNVSQSPLVVGQNVTFTIPATATETPNAAGNRTVYFSDVLPPGTTPTSASWNIGSCYIGASGDPQQVFCETSRSINTAVTSLGTITIQATVTQPGSFTNNCSFFQASGDNDPDGQAGCTVGYVVQAAESDLTFSKTGPGTIASGGTLNYTISGSNAGPLDATNVSVIDTLPAGTTFVSAAGAGWACNHAAGVVTCTRASLAVGAAPSIAIAVTAPVGPATLVNTCSASATQPDPTPADPTCTTTTTVQPPQADLSFSKAGPATVSSQGAIAYTISGTNNGPFAATNVQVVDTLPAGTAFVSASGAGWACNHAAGVVTCTRASLAVGAAPNITINATAPVGPTSITNTCTASATQVDPSPADPLCTTTTNVQPPQADLTFAKSGPATVLSAAQITWTIAGSNAGGAAATNVTVSDTLPAGVTFVSATGSGWACNHAAGVVTCTRPNLAVGVAPGITIVGTAPNGPATLTNTCTAAATENDPTPADPLCTTTTNVEPPAALTYAKTVNAGADNLAQPGETLTYSIAVNNAGGPTAVANVVTDAIPASTNYVVGSATGPGATFNAGLDRVEWTIPAGFTGAATLTFQVTVDNPTDAIAIENTHLVNGSNGCTTPPCTTTNVPTSDLEFAKAGPATVVSGNDITWSITGDNLGPDAATNVTVSDTLPAGVTFVSATGNGWACGNAANVVTCTRASLGVGAAPPISIVATAPTGPATLTNTCTASASENDSTPADSACTTTTVVDPPTSNLEFAKTGPASVASSGQITYSIQGANLGPNAATSVVVTDNLPAGSTFVSAVGNGWACNHAAGVVTCSRPTLPVGASPAIALTVTAPVGPATLVNTCAAAAAEVDPTPSDPACNHTTDVGPAPALTTAKSVNAGVDGVATAGEQLTYTIAVSNAGGPTQAETSIIDSIPAGTTYVAGSATGPGANFDAAQNRVAWSIPTGFTGNASLAFAVTVNDPVTVLSIENTHLVDGNLGCATPPCTTTDVPTADLSFSKAAPATILSGGAITWTISGANNGPDTATNVVVTDTLPANVTFGSAAGNGWSCAQANGVITCSRPSLTVGPAPAITITATANAGYSGALVNVCDASANENDPTASDPQCTTTTNVEPPADFTALKSVNAGADNAASPGEVLTYTIAVNNAGGPTSSAKSITDAIPAGTTYVAASVTGPGATYNAGQSRVEWTIPQGFTGSASLSFQVRVNDPVSVTSIANTHLIDGNVGCATPPCTTTTVPTSNLSFGKSGPASVLVGDDIAWSITGRNDGPDVATNVVVTDTLPQGAVFVAASGAGWSCVHAAGVVTCSRPSLSVGPAPAIAIVATAPATPATLTNVCEASADQNDSTPDDACETTTVVTPVGANLRVEVLDSADPVQPSQAFEYYVTVTNTSSETLSSISVANSFSESEGIGAMAGEGWACNAMSCTRPMLAGGASASFTVQVTAPASPASLSWTATASTADEESSMEDNTATEPTAMVAGGEPPADPVPVPASSHAALVALALALLALGSFAQRRRFAGR